jgi:ABC-type multidrug transport system fused ATPase/permease subunit
MKEEKREEGIVKSRNFYIYLGYASKSMLTLNFFIFSITTLLIIFGDRWLGKWAEDSFSYSTAKYSSFYLMIIIFYSIFAILQAKTYGKCTTEIGRKFFKFMYWNILRRKMEFFDTTPLGVLLNRCTTDIETIDRNIPRGLIDCIDTCFKFLFTMILTMVISPFSLIPMFITLILSSRFIKSYIKVSTDLRRLSKLTLSPILAKVSELVSGASSFRTYKIHDFIKENIDQQIELHFDTKMHEELTKTWVNFNVMMMIATSIVITCGILIFTKDKK